ncbi:14660_t:CDS:2, partial [Acaulospora morrowiae]
SIYGPEFPSTTPRDDVRLHRIVLDSMNVKKVAICIGGSMGGMQALEWSFFGPDYVKTIAPIATSARLSAWCISWNEAQRQSIYSDHQYCDGYYKSDETPDTGLAAARMSALLTYRSRDSFESRFSRKLQEPKKLQDVNGHKSTPAEKALLIHNEGHKSKNNEHLRSKRQGNHIDNNESRDENHLTSAISHTFSAQSYLRYQGDKFVKRFDANCYISLTRKMDSHDISKGRGSVEDVLKSIKQPTCVFGIESDGLFTISEQYELAKHIPISKMITIASPDGHDGFLLEFDQMNQHILQFIREYLPEISEKEHYGVDTVSIEVVKDSVFGELEDKDMIKW